MAIIFIRTVILYFAILISMRVMGKRQLGELEISEFIVAALIADLAATPLQDIGIPLLNGLVPIVIMFCLEIIIAGLNMHSVKLRKLTYGRPEMIIKNGKILRDAMLKNRFTLDELMQELRAQGLTDTSQVKYAVLETNGQLSVILNSADQPATAAQMGVDGSDVSYAHIIINEGRILDKNLALLGRDRRWLTNELKRQNVGSADDVYILTLSEDGSVFCQAKEG
ncbi:MAG: DUF421 domain-containing protein [Oscillospiraceae bacterium]|nr:DUF421 domain-containing protein [Oscillospiraceae bacterium]